MNEVDRYLQRATRGLWGQKKRDAQAELRGAVEDKVYRRRLLGLDEAGALALALRDLGSPAAIARELGAVHTTPQTLKVLAFVGVAGLLGLQAVAQVAVVKSAYLPVDLQTACRPPTIQELAAMPAARRERAERILKAQGGVDQYMESCRKTPFNSLVALKVADLVSALGAGGVMIAEQAGATSTTPLFVYGGPKGDIPEASYMTNDIQGERYLGSSMVIPFLKQTTTLPMRLDGLTNPVLNVGTAKLQLGTSAAPVRATDLLAFALVDQRRGNNLFPLPVMLSALAHTTLRDPLSPRLAVQGRDGELYAVVQNSSRIGGSERDLLSVYSLGGGLLDLVLYNLAAPLIVNSVEAMDAATAQGKEAILVYKLDASDLRNLKLTLLDAAQIKVVKP